MKNFLSFAFSLVAVAVAGFALMQPAPTVEVGANPGPFYTETQYLRGGVSVGGGVKINTFYATTTTWDSGALAGVDGTESVATTSASFILRQAGEGYALPGVGDTCVVGNESASSTVAEDYAFKITAVDTTSGFKNASATLTYVNYGALRDYGVATLNVLCFNQ